MKCMKFMENETFVMKKVKHIEVQPNDELIINNEKPLTFTVRFE